MSPLNRSELHLTLIGEGPWTGDVFGFANKNDLGLTNQLPILPLTLAMGSSTTSLN
jgi:hypothetical protein